MSLALDATQLDRYSRHIIMEEIGGAGQAALLEASVTVVGAGGLGAPGYRVPGCGWRGPDGHRR